MFNKTINLIIILGVLIGAQQVFAYNNYDLSKLDVLKTCKLDTKQEVNAETALSFTKSLFSWHIGDMYALAHSDMIAWHSAMTELLALYPEAEAKVPFKKGQFTKEQLASTMAVIAYSDDSLQYKVNLKRVDCVGNNKVVLVGDFTSTRINRDPKTGCVTHRVPYSSLLRISYDLAASAQNKNIQLVKGFDTYIEKNVTLKARAKLAEVMKNEKPLSPNPSTCKSLDQIYNEFNDQIVRN